MEKKHEIDLVYLWVDGNDAEWFKKKTQVTGIYEDNHSENSFKGRYSNNNELKYSLRSVEKHIPWVRQIFIVTDNQVPEWLNISNPKIKIIDHKDILPVAALPCFNSSVIEYFLHKIPNLSTHFLFANDDMFINADLTPNFFFSSDGLPIVRLKKKLLGKWSARIKMLVGKKLGQYAQMVADSALLVEKKFGKYYSGVPHHNIDAYLKHDYEKAVEVIFKEQVEKSQINHVRTYGDLHRSAFSYYVLAIKRAYLKYVTRNEASRILVSRHNFEQYLNRYQPKLFCLNDNQRVTDKNRAQIAPFLEKLFPIKSTFEK